MVAKTMLSLCLRNVKSAHCVRGAGVLLDSSPDSQRQFPFAVNAIPASFTRTWKAMPQYLRSPLVWRMTTQHHPLIRHLHDRPSATFIPRDGHRSCDSLLPLPLREDGSACSDADYQTCCKNGSSDYGGGWHGHEGDTGQTLTDVDRGTDRGTDSFNFLTICLTWLPRGRII